MRVDVVMPKMGESISEGTLIKWHKKKGDKVKKDEIIFEIATDKVDTEIPSPENGVLVDIKVFEQETVEVNTVVAVIDTNGEAVPAVEEKPEKEIPSTTQVGGEAIDIPMPKMGESVMEGTIIKWHKKVGDKVSRDEIIFEISTDKVDTEVPSPVDGILKEILHAENETVPVGVAVARISSSGGIVKTGAAKTETAAEEIPAVKVEEHTANFKSTDLSIPTNRFYSPLVLNIARKENIPFSELDEIPGRGIGGRLTKNDILEYLKTRPAPGMTQPVKSREDYSPKVSAETPKRTPGTRTEIIPMDNTRQRIMHHMINSRDTSVHVTAMIEVDMTNIYNFIETNKNSFQNAEGVKLTYMPFISFAVVKALKELPLMNSSIDGNNIVQKNYINLGIAVAVEPNGLIVPNIKNADEKNIRGLAKAIADLGLRARNKKLVPDDVVDGTFSITNYGVFGSLFGTPIINQPEVGIMGVGAVTKKPVVVELNGTDAIVIKPMMYLSLSHDHRLIDGMLGGKFLKAVKDALENFDTRIV